MSRPSLGYSNYYWIKRDQKRLEKQRKERIAKQEVQEVVAEETNTEVVEQVEVVEEKKVITAIAKPHNSTIFGKPNE